MELQRVLKPTGSIYLHCDPTASHYLKILLDSVFGSHNFLNEIVWQKIRSSKSQTLGFGKVHDIILFYSKSPDRRFNSQRVEHAETYLESHYRYVEPESNRRYRLDNFTQAGAGPARRFGKLMLDPPSGKHWIWTQDRIDEGMRRGLIVFSKDGMPSVKRYLDEVKGNFVEDIWADIPPINSMARERLGYPTQKPEALLERIITSSSNEGDIVLDPFCGCGTSIAVAQHLNRNWIGIDITHLAITLIKHRIRDTYGDQVAYQVIGEPVSQPDAETLAQQDPYQFQWWALGLVGARPVEQKKGADKGIDGRLYFHDDSQGTKTKQVILSVKAGHTNVAHVRDLRGVVEREKAEIGVLITMQESTQPMRTEAAGAGYYSSPGWNQDYPRLQILTIADLLEGKKIDMPPIRQVNATFKKAPKSKGKKGEQPELPLR